MATTGKTVVINSLPLCDLCGEAGTERPAVADARIPKYGSWANLCLEHFTLYGCSVGTGNGQQLIPACQAN